MGNPNSIQVPFNALGRGVDEIRAELDIAINRVLSSGWYVLGPDHSAFENELADYVGVEYAIACGNGTDAIQLGLKALGVEPNDSVMTAANAGGYTTTAVNQLGATAIYSDVEEFTQLLSVKTLQDAISRARYKPKVIVVTHLFGAAADVSNIVSWAHSENILILEDCAQSLGAMAGDKRAGAVGDISTTSFYPTKNLGALGDGGAVMTNDLTLANNVRSLRQYGWSSKYKTNKSGGMNSRLDELQAAILRVKLPKLDVWNERRREIHSRYVNAAQGRLNFVNRDSSSFVAHLAVITSPHRDQLSKFLNENGIATDVHYPIPDHLQEINSQRSDLWSLPVTEKLANQILSIPIFPELTEKEISHIESVLNNMPKTF